MNICNKPFSTDFNHSEHRHYLIYNYEVSSNFKGTGSFSRYMQVFSSNLQWKVNREYGLLTWETFASLCFPWTVKWIFRAAIIGRPTALCTNSKQKNTAPTQFKYLLCYIIMGSNNEVSVIIIIYCKIPEIQSRLLEPDGYRTSQQSQYIIFTIRCSVIINSNMT
jgi:hypothetical protein